MMHEETEAELAAPAHGKALPIAIIAAGAAVSAVVIGRNVYKAAYEGTVKQAEKMKNKKKAKDLES